MERPLEDVIFTLAVVGGFFWLAYAVGSAGRMDFPWAWLQLAMAAAGAGAALWAWLMARDERWARANIGLGLSITLLVTWAAWVPRFDFSP